MITIVMMPVTVVRCAACSYAASSTGPASARATCRLSAGEKKIPANAAIVTYRTIPAAIQNVVKPRSASSTIKIPVTGSTTYAGLATRASSLRIPFRTYAECSFDRRTPINQTKYVRLVPTAVIAASTCTSLIHWYVFTSASFRARNGRPDQLLASFTRASVDRYVPAFRTSRIPIISNHRVMMVGAAIPRTVVIEDDSRQRAADTSDHGGPPKPARVDVAEGSGKPVQNEGEAGKDQVQWAQQGEVDGVLGSERGQGSRSKLWGHGQPRLGEVFGGETIERQENHSTGSPDDCCTQPKPC